MRTKLSIPPLFFLLVLTACTTYDRPIVYHKNFHPGAHPLLRFDGMYASPPEKELLYKPVYFFADGSAFSAIRPYPMSTDPKRMEGSWGNFRVDADTILLERFDKVGSNYRRVILKGIITPDAIHWTARREHKSEYEPVDYSIIFYSAPKPDSTQNWTRKRKKYNE